MTTTSSFPFSTMEVPSMDDNMEMASPYHGPVDDFDIDIDIMEDQASNPDRDMTAADDYMDNSHEETHGQDGSPDEDMIDDEAEPSMVDADEYAEADQNIDIQYEEAKTDGENKTYEADMLQEDYDEDIDEPVPDHEVEAPVSLEQVDTGKALESAPEESLQENHKDHLEPQPQTVSENLDETQKVQSDLDSKPVAEAEQPEQPEQPVEEAETAHVEAPHTEDTTKDTTKDTTVPEQLETSEPHAVNLDHQDAYEESGNPENKEEDSNQTQPSTDDHKEPEVEFRPEQQDSESHDRDADQDHGLTETSTLYPVKVYYQDNEISLFPPREGDVSETFFLEDESLAHQSFGTLVSACRQVLRDHVNENEVLVIDIETLNFQLTEDSRETHNFSLKQIVDVYLQLCHNDGVEEPEALYLTLSTKPTVAAELSDLMIAASEGKGLSEIQSWEVYPEEGVAEYDDVAQVSHEGDRDTSNEENAEVAVDTPKEHNSLGQDAHDYSDNVSETRDNEATEIREDGPGVVDAGKPEDHVSPHQGPTSPQVPSPNSEEQHTESTGTLEPLPTTDAVEDRPEPEGITEHIYDEVNEEDYHEGEFGDDHHHEDGSVENPVEPVDVSEEHEQEYAADLSEEHAEEYNDLESGQHEQLSTGEDSRNDTARSEGNVSDNDSHHLDDSKAIGSASDETSPEQSYQPQHVADDSLVAAEPLDASNGDLKAADRTEVDNAGEPGEVDGTTENENAVPSLNETEEPELPFEDEDDYLDLGIADDLGDFDDDQDAASTSHVSGKRTREPDDELELPESTTPDAKRSRSS
ncbi:hypothetical protein BDV18DRAFT_131612 [Aspergillus unguis]